MPESTSTTSSEPSARAQTGGPYISASTSLPEITPKALFLGFILSAVLAGANAYLGLKVGMTVSASIPAAVISMALLKAFKESNILENNIVQTAASAGESLAAGVIFTLPALIMLRYWEGFPFLETMSVALCGGIIGVLFTIPLRRALILEAELQFPEGIATGEVLKAGDRGGGGAKYIAIAGLAGAAMQFFQTGLKVVGDSVSGAVTAGKSVFGIASGLGVALLSVGYIVGLNIATLVFLGGAIAWFVGIPLYTALADPATLQSIVGDATGWDAALSVWDARIRYMGVGAMATGGLWALVALIEPIRDGIRSSMDAVRRAKDESTPDITRTERDTPINFVLGGAAAMAVPIFIVFTFVVDQTGLGISSGLYWLTIVFGVLFAFVAGFLFSSVAGYMAGLVGSSNNPISGVTIATILTVSLILLVLLGSQIDFAVDTSQAAAAAATAILVGAVVCCAAAIAGDNMQDLKAGHIVGATPMNQQIMQVVGVVAASLAIAPVMDLLFSAYGFGDVLPRAGMDPSEALAAPQATLMSSVADGVFSRNLPWTMIGLGVLIAIAIIVWDKWLESRESSFRAPVLAVAVGIYLPIDLSVPIFIGGLIAYFAARSATKKAGEEEPESQRGLLFASGLITGEALVGIFLAIPFAIQEDANALAISPDMLGLSPAAFATMEQTLGVVLFAGFCFWLYQVAKK
ncbi:oligopeptide transporter, OPT family [Longibacter salinarum]|uniref:Oligopeptide transporter, OPT family n=1 Tax=Longibacter salinarum TaxID=1850348 RepID=A0A2A8CYR2_9BACT|nr:oligopeptide transporter, OPT family [Longibacter salinarum]PEN13717.1 oligopeptide transporter, OPT family [Longibacter salinarum]